MVQRFLGKRLTRLSRAEFISDGSGSGPLEFEFEDGSRLVLDLVVDGESVSVSTQGLDFQSHDTWVRRDLEAPDLIGSRLTRLDALHSEPSSSSVAAWRVFFGSSHVFFGNNGNDATVELGTTPEGWGGTWVVVNSERDIPGAVA